MKRINHTSSGENLIGILLSISIGIALTFFNAGRTVAHSTQSLPPIDFTSCRIKVQQIYTSQIGIREKHPNAGPDVEKYLRYVNLPKGNPWCAAFVCWVFGKAGVANPRSGWSPDLFREGRVIWGRGEQGTRSKEQRLPPSEPLTFFKIGYPKRPAWQLATGNWQPTNHYSQLSTVPSSPPIPMTGDVFGLYFPEKARIAHVGFIDQWDETWLISVEGNTNVSGSREGDGVYRKRRLVRTVYKVARYLEGN